MFQLVQHIYESFNSLDFAVSTLSSELAKDLGYAYWQHQAIHSKPIDLIVSFLSEVQIPCFGETEVAMPASSLVSSETEVGLMSSLPPCNDVTYYESDNSIGTPHSLCFESLAGTDF